MQAPFKFRVVHIMQKTRNIFLPFSYFYCHSNDNLANDNKYWLYSIVRVMLKKPDHVMSYGNNLYLTNKAVIVDIKLLNTTKSQTNDLIV